MKLKRILAGALAALTLFTLASCGAKPGKEAVLSGTDDPFVEAVEDSFKEMKKEAKEDDGSLSYSIKWKSGWDKSWKEQYCEDVKEWTLDKFNDEMKDEGIKLITLQIKGKMKEEGEKAAKYDYTFYLGIHKEKEVIFAAGGKLIVDGEVRKLTASSAHSMLAELVYDAQPSNPF